MRIAYQSKAELEHFYHDIFERELYLRNGITINAGDCIFDVGSNIGLFSLFAFQKQRELDVYMFEPAPPLHSIIRTNLALHGLNAKLFTCGLSAASNSALFTFYPKSSGMSSFYADTQEEEEALRVIMLNQLAQGMEGMEEIMEFADDILADRLQHETYTCQLRTASDIILANAVERIDLLKIDAQKSELDILKGITGPDWNKISQIVMEVHDLDGRLSQIVDLLSDHGYDVISEQDDLYRGSNLHNVYAVRV
ncbi:MAG: hypothetical protein QOI07_3191 [Verrucomicrobiota bacterium]|jgi:FkbM family methyltransferase